VSGFTLIAGFEARHGHEQQLLHALTAMIEPSLAEPGCLAYRPYVDPNTLGRMIIVEEWASQAALDSHFSSPHFLQVAAALDELLAKPFTLRRLVVAALRQDNCDAGNAYASGLLPHP